MNWVREFFNTILLLLKNPRVLVSSILICSAFLFLPAKCAAYLGIAPMCDEHRHWFGVLLLICVSVLVVQAFSGAWYEAARRTRVRRELRSLSGEEWRLLLKGLDNYHKTIIQEMGHTGAQQALVNKGILLEGHGRGNILAWPFTVDNYAWGYLQRHPRLVARGRAIAQDSPANHWRVRL